MADSTAPAKVTEQPHASNGTTTAAPTTDPAATNAEQPGEGEDANKPSKKGAKKAARDAAKAKAKADKALARATDKLAGTSVSDKPAAPKKPKVPGGGSYEIGLKNTEKGVVTRFPPEPSGYLHIGHAKAACLNDYFAHVKYNGTLICRFDDTNPLKEKVEFTHAIVEDLALMNILPDKTSYTSDYFDELYDYAIQLIKLGKAFADDTPQIEMKEQRMARKPSPRRDATVEETLERFEEMKKGTPEGKRWCLRAKIRAEDANGALRDPVIYRCPTNKKVIADDEIAEEDADNEVGGADEPVEEQAGVAANTDPTKDPAYHARTKDKWKMYPTYDFACPVVDSMEGVTHALRTIEYRDRNAQYQWFLDTLKLRQVDVWDFARMNFIRTLLSKRKLTKLVDAGVVNGWDDPRLPTIRGVRRRGMTIEALREFMIVQGPSQRIVNMDWTVFWSTNKKHIDPVAPRHTAVLKDKAVKATITKGDNIPDTPRSEDKPKHGKNPEAGQKKVWYSKTIWFDQEDAQSFEDDEEITLMNWGNAFVRSKTKSDAGEVTGIELELNLEGDFKKTKKKVTWLSADQKLIPLALYDFDFLLNKEKLDEKEEEHWEDFLTKKTEFHAEAFADCNIPEVRAGDIIQLERKGYFRCDRAYGGEGKPAVLFNIPTGKQEQPMFSK